MIEALRKKYLCNSGDSGFILDLEEIVAAFHDDKSGTLIVHFRGTTTPTQFNNREFAKQLWDGIAQLSGIRKGK